mmetsp:Transcript_28863/g.47844  ORF Transcript_28863/g.47844 Transcript_28863/m.47844 type:complete len:113 (+) Transcript_28863:955-1293(+)
MAFAEFTNTITLACCRGFLWAALVEEAAEEEGEACAQSHFLRKESNTGRCPPSHSTNSCTTLAGGSATPRVSPHALDVLEAATLAAPADFASADFASATPSGCMLTSGTLSA